MLSDNVVDGKYCVGDKRAAKPDGVFSSGNRKIIEGYCFCFFLTIGLVVGIACSVMRFPPSTSINIAGAVP